MAIGVIGRKLGMTSVFTPEGESIPVSVVEIQPNTVTALRTDERDGYTAVQLGAGTARQLTKPRKGQLNGLPQVQHAREFRLDDISEYEIGQTLDVSLFEEGETVDVSGVSKGRGFAGTVKRHHFRRGPETHGSDSHRQPGSIGAGTYPGKVFKGTPMAGRMGNDTITIKKVTVVRADAERNLLLIKGALPGARNALVIVRKAAAQKGTAS
jgi:large subunit ribosomal protein L3